MTRTKAHLVLQRPKNINRKPKRIPSQTFTFDKILENVQSIPFHTFYTRFTIHQTSGGI